VRASTALESLKGANDDQTVGINILRRAIQEPLRMIVRNCGEEASVVLNKVREGKGNFGYNASNNTFGDMLDAGIIDPAKVTRLALQNAASVAGLLLTTEAMIAEAPQKNDAPAMPGGGGMGDMGGMGGMGGF
jgi:chaperonin GroEL